MKILFRFILPLSGIVLLGMLVFSPWLAWVIQAQIRSQWLAMGADEVAIEAVDVNLIHGRVDIRHLLVKHAGQTVLRVNTASIDWRWQDLSHQTLHYGAVDGGFARLQVHADKRVGLQGLAMPASNTKPSDEPLPGFLLRRLDITQFRLLIAGVEQAQMVSVHDLRLMGLGTPDPGGKARSLAQIAARIGLAQGGLEIAGDLQPFAESFATKLKLTLTNLQLDALTGLMPKAQAMQVKNADKASVTGVLAAELSLDMDAEQGVAVEGELRVANVQAQRAAKAIKASGIVWQGRTTRSRNGVVALKGRLQAENVSMQDRAEKLTADFGTGHWQGMLSVSANGESVHIKGLAKLVSLELQRLGNPPEQVQIAIAMATWNASTHVGLGKTATMSSADTINIDGLGIKLPLNELQIRQEKSHWKGRVVRTSAHWKLAGVLNGERLKLSDDEGMGRIDAWHWKGEAEADLGTRTSVQVDSKVFSLHDALLTKDNGSSVASRDVQWQGKLVLTKNKLAEIYGDIQLSNFRSVVNETPLGLADLEARSVKLDSQGGLSIKTIVAKELWVDQRKRKQRSHARMQRFSLDNLSVSPSPGSSPSTRHVAVGSVTMNAPDIRLVRSKGKQWQIPAVKTSVDSGIRSGKRKSVSRKAVLQQSVKESAPGWSVGKLNIRKGRIKIQDYSLSSVDQPVLSNLNVRIQSLDSRRPQVDSSLKLAATIGEYGRLSLTGTVQPLADKVSLDLTGNIEGMGLTEFNVYVEDALGQRIQSGQMDADLVLKIVKNELDVHSKLVIHKLEMQALPVPREGADNDTKDAANKKGGGTLPIGLALTLLRDSNNQISLELPLKGRLDDPEFDPGDAISQAVGSAMTTGVALFIQPLGSLLIAGKVIAGAASAIRFEPAVFAAGSRELDSKQRAYLSELAEKLKARPQMHMKVCGRATLADQRVFQPQKDKAAKDEKPVVTQPVPGVTARLRTLAKQRGRVVRAYLVKQAGVDHKQLVACSAAIENDDALPPRVELGL